MTKEDIAENIKEMLVSDTSMAYLGELPEKHLQQLHTDLQAYMKRLDDNQRATNRARRQSYLERMDAKAAARAELEAERNAGIWTDDEGFAVSKEEDSE